MTHCVQIAFGLGAILMLGPCFVAIGLGLLLRWLDAVVRIFNEGEEL